MLQPTELSGTTNYNWQFTLPSEKFWQFPWQAGGHLAGSMKELHQRTLKESKVPKTDWRTRKTVFRRTMYSTVLLAALQCSLQCLTYCNNLWVASQWLDNLQMGKKIVPMFLPEITVPNRRVVNSRYDTDVIKKCSAHHFSICTACLLKTILCVKITHNRSSHSRFKSTWCILNHSHQEQQASFDVQCSQVH